MRLGPVYRLTPLLPYSRGRMNRFHFLFMGRGEEIHFWSGRVSESPSPSLALVSIVFVLLTSVQDLSFTLFTLFFSCDRLDSFSGKEENSRFGSTFVRLLNPQ